MLSIFRNKCLSITLFSSIIISTLTLKLRTTSIPKFVLTSTLIIPIILSIEIINTLLRTSTSIRDKSKTFILSHRFNQQIINFSTPIQKNKCYINNSLWIGPSTTLKWRKNLKSKKTNLMKTTTFKDKPGICTSQAFLNSRKKIKLTMNSIYKNRHKSLKWRASNLEMIQRLWRFAMRRIKKCLRWLWSRKERISS